jgi:uncharacterized membrane protein SirB2
MSALKLVHLGSALLSIAFFVVRGLWRIGDARILQRKWVRISPHVIDTVLLVSAIALAVQLSISPLAHPWLLAKIIALVVYIGLGVAVMRIANTRGARVAFFLAAVAVFAYIVAVAVTKSVVPFA